MYDDRPWQATPPQPVTPAPATPPVSAVPDPSPYGYPAAYGPPGYPAPVAPPLRRGIGPVAVVAIVAAAALIGCGSGVAIGLSVHTGRAGTPVAATTAGAPPSGASATGTGPAASASVPAAAPIAPGDGAALLAKILPMPAGAKAVTVSGSTGGVMDVDQFVKKEFASDPTELGRMRSRDFRVAAQRDWTAADGTEVHIQLIQFGADIGAESYVLGQTHAYQAESTVTATFPIPAATHGTGFEESGLDAAGNRRTTMLAQDGPLTVFIFVFTPGAFDRAAYLTLMRRQLAALAAHS